MKALSGVGDEPMKFDVTIQNALSILQNNMATRDLFSNNSPNSGQGLELLLKKHLELKIRMDANLNHFRAHLHIDYGKNRHIASYAIDNGELLAGKATYNSEVQPWIAEHRPNLLLVWKDLRGKGADETIVAELSASSI